MLLPEGESCFESLQEKNIIEIKIRKNSFLITVDFVQKVKNFLNFINLNTNCMKFLFTLILSATVFLLNAQTSAVLRDKSDTIRLIQQTVSLYDLDFTDAEADSMMDNINYDLGLYKGMHKTLPTNDIPYPFAFNPAPLGMKVPTKKIKTKKRFLMKPFEFGTRMMACFITSA